MLQIAHDNNAVMYMTAVAVVVIVAAVAFASHC